MKRSNKHSPRATKLFDHIRELQIRLVVCFVVMAVAGIIVYLLYEPILALLRSPLHAPLYYNNPSGSFAFVMKICLMGSITVSIPVIIYNLIMFVRPAFEKLLPLRRVYFTTGFSIVMAAAGAIFAFVCILPGTLKFFEGFQVSGLHALISADSYLSFVTNMIITFVLVFQIPLLISLIDSIKPLPPKKMIKIEKWVILGSLIISALVPFAWDLMTCAFIAVPIVVLYNLSIILVVIQHARVARKGRAHAVQSLVVRSESNLASMPETAFSFDEIVDELIGEKRPNMVKTVNPRRVSMDIRPIRTIKTCSQFNRPPAKVLPAAHFQNRPKQTVYTGTKTRLISDFGHGSHHSDPIPLKQKRATVHGSSIYRVPRINRVLA